MVISSRKLEAYCFDCILGESINHVRCHLNGAAHSLVKEALTVSEEHVLIEEVTQCISVFISTERCT